MRAVVATGSCIRISVDMCTEGLAGPHHIQEKRDHDGPRGSVGQQQGRERVSRDDFGLARQAQRVDVGDSDERGGKGDEHAEESKALCGRRRDEELGDGARALPGGASLFLRRSARRSALRQAVRLVREVGCHDGDDQDWK